MEYIQVFVSASDEKEAFRIADELIDNKLAACVQIVGPVTSVYRWKNKKEKTSEWICIIKSKKEIYSKLENKIKEIHTYEVPEIVVLPIVNGNKDYLKWLEQETA